MMRRKKQKSLQGVVYAEALIVAPIFGILLAGVVLFNGMFSSKLDALSKSRRQAWIQAMSADCPESGEAACEGTGCENESAVGSATGDAGGVDGVAGMLGDAVEFLTGAVTTATGSTSAYVPTMFGDDKTHTGRTTLMCNAGGGSLDGTTAIGEGKDSSGVNEAMQ